MKIITTTYHCAYNYGAVLQAYSLVRWLKNEGHEAAILDYWPDFRIRDKESVFRDFQGYRDLIINLSTLINYRKINEKRSRFDRFYEDFLTVTSRRYRSLEEILSCPPEVGACITGSDQVWNPLTGEGTDPVYYLSFSKEIGAKSIAYAPSIGISTIPDEHKKEMSGLIGKLDFLSSREPKGSEQVKELTGRDCVTVLDPVFLSSEKEWGKVAGASNVKIGEPYILVYAVRRRPFFYKSIMEMKKKTGYKVVAIIGANPAVSFGMPADETIWEAGPCDFVSLFSEAALVMTNSFHGTAFSMIFRRPFLSFPHTGKDARVYGILNRVNQEHRIVAEGESLPNPFTDLDSLNDEIDRNISLSEDYLRRALN